MSMKYFTVSALCVLVFCMLLALGGTTGLPEDGSLTASVGSMFAPTSTQDAGRVHPGTSTAILADWSTPASEESSIVDSLKRIGKGRMIRLVGLLFIMGWFVLSIKLLTVD